MKGRYRVNECKRCHRRRRIYHVGEFQREYCVGSYCKVRPFDIYECSQGHQWEVIRSNLSLMSDALKAYYNPVLKKMFSRPSPFYQRMSR